MKDQKQQNQVKTNPVKTTLQWVLAGALAAGTVGLWSATPARAAEPAREGKEIKGPGGEVESVVKYDDLSKDVQHAFDRERGDKKLYDIMHVRKPNGQAFFRARVEVRGEPHYIRVGEDGSVLSQTDVNLSREPAREPAKETRTARPNTARPNVATNRPEVVTFDTLPGQAKNAIGREAGVYTQRGKVYKSVNHNGLPIYSAQVSDGNRSKMITVDAMGKVYSEADDTRAGEKVIKFEAVPFNPKKTIGSEAGAGRVNRVLQGTRNGTTYYTALVQDTQGPFWVTVDDKGNIIKEVDAK